MGFIKEDTRSLDYGSHGYFSNKMGSFRGLGGIREECGIPTIDSLKDPKDHNHVANIEDDTTRHFLVNAVCKSRTF